MITTTAIVTITFLFCGILWLSTSKDPLYWLAAVCLVSRAAIIQAVLSGAVFLRHFRLRFRGTLRAQQEVRVV